MSDQLIADGRYKVQHRGATLAAQSGAPLMVQEDTGGDEIKWDVASKGDGSYTLRNVATGIYLGDEADPTSMAPMLKGVSDPFAWKIERAPDEEAFVLSTASSNGEMRLALSPIKIFPPPVAWMPSAEYGQFWRLTKV